VCLALADPGGHVARRNRPRHGRAVELHTDIGFG
jgi:hypothetical protein